MLYPNCQFVHYQYWKWTTSMFSPFSWNMAMLIISIPIRSVMARKFEMAYIIFAIRPPPVGSCETNILRIRSYWLRYLKADKGGMSCYTPLFRILCRFVQTSFPCVGVCFLDTKHVWMLESKYSSHLRCPLWESSCDICKSNRPR